MSDRNYDEKLAAALFDVPLPEGLLGRLLDRLQNDVGGDSIASLPAPRVVSGRRGWIYSLISLAAAAAAMVAVGLGVYSGSPVSAQAMLDEAIWAFDGEAHQQGVLLTEKPAPAAYPFSQAVVPFRGMRWHAIEGGRFGGREGIVYEIPGPEGVNASLYVLDGGVGDELDTAPASSPFTTAGCCASLWQENGLLYVLVVQGDTSVYRDYLNRPQNPVANGRLLRSLLADAMQVRQACDFL